MHELQEYGLSVDVHDPWAGPAQALIEYGLELVEAPVVAVGDYDGILLAVNHSSFVAQGAEAMRAYGKPGHVFFDLKSCFGVEESDLRL